MDGVIANMVPHSLKWLGYEELANFVLQNWPAGNNHFYLSGTLGINEDRLKFMHREDFWTEIPPYENAQELLDLLCELVGEKNVYILSSPGHYRGAWSGKFEWLECHFPGFESRLILTRHKDLMAGPAILIDDKYKTYQKVNASSDSNYRCVLYPAPWNENRKVSEPIDYIHSEIVKIAKELGYVSSPHFDPYNPTSPKR